MFFLVFVARETGWYLLLTSLCTNCWKTDRCYPGGKEPEEDGRGWLIGWVCVVYGFAEVLFHCGYWMHNTPAVTPHFLIDHSPLSYGAKKQPQNYPYTGHHRKPFSIYWNWHTRWNLVSFFIAKWSVAISRILKTENVCFSSEVNSHGRFLWGLFFFFS